MKRIYDIKVDGSTLYSKCYDVDEHGRKSNHDDWQKVKSGISVESLKEACVAWGFTESKAKGHDVDFRFYQND